MNRTWRPVLGYEHLYEVSDYGEVRGVKRGKILKHCLIGKAKHQAVVLCAKGFCKTRLVHQLVCEAFHGPRPQGLIALHRDDNKDNNRKENVYWGTYVDNALDSLDNNGSSKLTWDKVQRIRLRIKGGEKSESVRRDFNISSGCISSIKTERTWKQKNLLVPP